MQKYIDTYNMLTYLKYTLLYLKIIFINVIKKTFHFFIAFIKI